MTTDRVRAAADAYRQVEGSYAPTQHVAQQLGATPRAAAQLIARARAAGLLSSPGRGGPGRRSTDTHAYTAQLARELGIGRDELAGALDRTGLRLCVRRGGQP